MELAEITQTHPSELALSGSWTVHGLGSLVGDLATLRIPPHSQVIATRQWVDTPAEMLKPIIVAELRGGTGLLHVTEAPGGMVSDVILNAQIRELEQDFTVTRARRASS
jgi:ABC-type uncharacterized transport system auxiliary subunit